MYRPPMQEFGSSIVIREAQHSDSHSLLKWRNDPLTRSVSINSDIISPQEHEAWLASALSSNQELLLIGMIDNRDIGTSRFSFDLSSSEATVSINIIEEFRGQGLASDFLAASMQFCIKNKPWLQELKAEIRQGNEASVRIFTKNGFELFPSNLHKGFDLFKKTLNLKI